MAKRTGKIDKKQTQGIGDPLEPRLLPLKQGAARLGLSVWALRERIWAGQIPVVQFPGGRKMYVDSQDLEDVITKNKRIIR